MNRIFHWCLAGFCASLIAACSSETIHWEEKPALIPIPQEISLEDNVFRLTSHTTIGLDNSNKELVSIAQYLNSKISPALGYELEVKDKGDILFKLSDDIKLGEEGYTLDISTEKIEIQAAHPAGIFYGIQTLLQMFPKEIKSKEKQRHTTWAVTCGNIVDKPQFPWRGLMLDVSRHWFTKEEVMKYIDELAEYKMNVFHWHLTDDQGWRIEIKSLPRLTEVGSLRAPRVGQWWTRTPQRAGEKATYGGYYTQEDIKEVIEYARKRYVRVIPEVDVPGHSLAALVAYPELACFKAPEYINVGNTFYGIDENSLCVGNEKTFDFLDKVFTEVTHLFPDEYIHIGGDECYKGFWTKCPKCQKRKREEGLKDEKELQSYFVRRLEKMLQSKGKKLIGWNEILEGGLAPDATVMSWTGMEDGIRAAKANHHVIMTPTQHCYLDLYQGEPNAEPNTYSMCRLSDSYRFNPVPADVPAEFILGGQGNLWTESVPTFRHAEYMTWPRGWALAEVLWSGPDQCEWKDFWPRVEKHFDRADEAQINYARSMYNAIITPYMENEKIKIKLSCEITDTDIYYTFDNTDPDPFTPQYTQPLSIPEGATWLRVVTYRHGKPSGKIITVAIEELKKRIQ